MQLERNVGIFRRVATSLFQRNLVKGELILTLASDLFEGNGFMFQPAVGKTVHIVAARHAVENVRLEHGIERNPAQLNVVISQNAAIVFEILPDLEHLLILQQRFKQRQHALARDLIRRIKIIMRYRDIGGHAWLNSE